MNMTSALHLIGMPAARAAAVAPRLSGALSDAMTFGGASLAFALGFAPIDVPALLGQVAAILLGVAGLWIRTRGTDDRVAATDDKVGRLEAEVARLKAENKAQAREMAAGAHRVDNLETGQTEIKAIQSDRREATIAGEVNIAAKAAGRRDAEASAASIAELLTPAAPPAPAEGGPP